jgi:hypothetical protein
MAVYTINKDQLRSILIKNWMTHDALWYGEVATKFGMSEASPMNLRVCRKLGQIEFGRLMKMVETPSPKNIEEYQELFEVGEQVFFPDFVSAQISYPGNDSQIFDFLDCFAYKGMKKLGLLPDYECGIFERIEGWFDAMELHYTRTPDLSRCLRLKGNKCRITVQFHFESREVPSLHKGNNEAKYT